MALVSIVMPCAYGVRFIKQAIESVFAQTHKDWEILFVDDGATDGSAEIARSYEGTGKLRYLRMPERISVYAARNLAIENSRGDYIAFLDVDDVWKSDFLEQLLGKMKPGIDFVYGGFRDVDANGNSLGRTTVSRRREGVVNALLYRNFISICCVILRSELVKAEKFDSGYKLIGDFELWVRLNASGHACDYVDKCIQLNRIHTSNSSILQHKSWVSDERKFYRSFFRKYRLKYPMIIYYIVKCELSYLIGRRRM